MQTLPSVAMALDLMSWLLSWLNNSIGHNLPLSPYATILPRCAKRSTLVNAKYVPTTLYSVQRPMATHDFVYELQACMWERFTTKPFVDSGELKAVDGVPTPWPCFTSAVLQDTVADEDSKTALGKVLAAMDEATAIMAVNKILDVIQVLWWETITNLLFTLCRSG